MGRLFTHRIWGLVAVLAVAAALFLARAVAAGPPWTDEQYTTLLVNRTPQRIVELCAMDAHPPGFYLLVKLWLKPFRLAGIEPSIVVGRLHGLPWKLLTLAIAWFAGRRAFGAAAGTCVAWMLCLAPRLLEASCEMRQYSIIAPALPALFLLMMAAREMDRDGERGGIVAAWSLYGGLAAICLWCHLLSGLGLLVLGLAWMGMCASLGRRMLASSFFAGGAIAQAFAVACFVPWMGRVAGNHDYLMATKHAWMTPPTAANLLYTVAWWMPFGSFDDEVPGANRLKTLLGVASSAVPIAVFLATKGRRGRTAPCGPARRGVLALCCGAAAIMALWLLARAEIAQVFHGYRYPIIGWGFWIVGLGLLSVSAAMSTGRAWVGGAALLPWMAITGWGLATELRSQPYSHLLDPTRQYRDLLPPEGGPIYVMPPELIPAARSVYPSWELRHIEELRNHPPTEAATVVYFSQWGVAHEERDRALAYAVEHHRLSRQVQTYRYNDTVVSRMRALRPEVLALFGERDWNEFRRESIGRAVSEAGVEWQNPSDGWYDLESEGEGRPFRRAITSPAIARFNRPVPAGDYILRMEGYQMPYPSPTVDWRMRFPGEAPKTLTVSGWDFDLEVPITLTRDHEKPFVAIERPVWVPADFIDGSEDLRPFSFTLRQMWLEKMPASR